MIKPTDLSIVQTYKINARDNSRLWQLMNLYEILTYQTVDTIFALFNTETIKRKKALRIKILNHIDWYIKKIIPSVDRWNVKGSKSIYTEKQKGHHFVRNYELRFTLNSVKDKK